HQGWVDTHPQAYIHGVETWTARRAHGAVVCSHYMRGHVADVFGIDEATVSVIPNVGLRFHSRDARSLGRMIERVLTDDGLRDRLVLEASEHVLRFDWGDVARQTAKVYASFERVPARITR
nr:glycosyltransferase [Solirubrobacterales bacterium]